MKRKAENFLIICLISFAVFSEFLFIALFMTLLFVIALPISPILIPYVLIKSMERRQMAGL